MSEVNTSNGPIVQPALQSTPEGEGAPSGEVHQLGRQQEAGTSKTPQLPRSGKPPCSKRSKQFYRETQTPFSDPSEEKRWLAAYRAKEKHDLQKLCTQQTNWNQELCEILEKNVLVQLCCDYRNKYFKLHDKSKAQKSKIKKMKGEYMEVQSKNKELQDKYKELQDQNKELQDQNKELQDQNKELQDQNKKLQD